jgi:hypothetical protein
MFFTADYLKNEISLMLIPEVQTIIKSHDFSGFKIPPTLSL